MLVNSGETSVTVETETWRRSLPFNLCNYQPLVRIYEDNIFTFFIIDLLMLAYSYASTWKYCKQMKQDVEEPFAIMWKNVLKESEYQDTFNYAIWWNISEELSNVGRGTAVYSPACRAVKIVL